MNLATLVNTIPWSLPRTVIIDVWLTSVGTGASPAAGLSGGQPVGAESDGRLVWRRRQQVTHDWHRARGRTSVTVPRPLGRRIGRRTRCLPQADPQHRQSSDLRRLRRSSQHSRHHTRTGCTQLKATMTNAIVTGTAISRQNFKLSETFFLSKFFVEIGKIWGWITFIGGFKVRAKLKFCAIIIWANFSSGNLQLFVENCNFLLLLF